MDLRTVSVVVAVACVLLASILVVQYRLHPQYRGLRLWAFGQAVMTLAFLPAVLEPTGWLRGALGIAANMATVVSLLCVYAGLMVFMNRRVPVAWMSGYAALALAGSAYYTVIDPNLQLRRFLNYVFVAVLQVLLVRAVRRYSEPFMRQSAIYLTVVFGLGATLYTVLAIGILRSTDVADKVWVDSPVVLVAFLGAVMVMMLWTFGMVFMVGEHLRFDLAEDRHNLRQIFLASPDATAISRLEDGLIRDINEGFTRMFGYTSDDAVGRLSSDLGLWADPAARQAMVRAIDAEGAIEDLHTRFVTKDGRLKEVAVSARELRLSGQSHIVTVTRDVTESSRLERELRRQALTDDLTGVANRRAFLAALAPAVGQCSLIVIDLDGFKQINDTLGHAAGDAIVREFASKASASLPAGGLIGRLGGDEFGVLLPGCADVQARQWAESLLSAISGFTFSAGVSQKGATIDELMASADRALYRAKDRGRNCVELSEV